MILTINAGSTSLKYALFSDHLKEITGGEFLGAQLDKGLFKEMMERLHHSEPITKIVHRVVHGGPKNKDPLIITPSLLNKLRKYNHLAPLHNPFNLVGIELAQTFFPSATHYAVFDTGFFKNLPEKTRLYPLPYEFALKHGIERYGFHGISHQYALYKAGEKLRDKSPNLISLHLGGGCSISAIQKGKPIDTSMGFTPLEGLMMWARAGDIDPGILMINPDFDAQNPKKTLTSTEKNKKWEHILNYESGLKGVSGCKDYLDLIKKYRLGNKKARLAMDMFTYRIQKYIGAYYAALQGKVDAIVFTGKIGAGEAITRKCILRHLPFLGRAKKIILRADEEWMMAKSIQHTE